MVSSVKISRSLFERLVKYGSVKYETTSGIKFETTKSSVNLEVNPEVKSDGTVSKFLKKTVLPTVKDILFGLSIGYAVKTNNLAYIPLIIWCPTTAVGMIMIDNSNLIINSIMTLWLCGSIF